MGRRALCGDDGRRAGLAEVGAKVLDAVVTETMISATTATGRFLIFGLDLGLLDLKEVRVANMLPALLLAPCSLRLALCGRSRLLVTFAVVFGADH